MSDQQRPEIVTLLDSIVEGVSRIQFFFRHYYYLMKDLPIDQQDELCEYFKKTDDEVWDSVDSVEFLFKKDL